MILEGNRSAVVWDLDETLGYFVEFGMFWEALQKYSHSPLTEEDFSKVLDLYPEFLRPNVLKVLTLLKTRKKLDKGLSVILYTNNQGPKTWAQHIVAYFNNKLRYKLFDDIIPAYKVNGRQVSPCRTGHEKKYSDLLRCTGLPAGTHVCFIDDQEHDKMKNSHVHYIHIKAYKHDLPFDTMTNRLATSKIGKALHLDSAAATGNIEEFLQEYDFVYSPKPPAQLAVDKIVTKRLYKHIRDFCSETAGKPKTRRNKTKAIRRTYRLRN